MRRLLRHRLSLALGAIFIVDGIAYWVVEYLPGSSRENGAHADLTGVVALVALGIAMAFVFGVLLSGSGEPGE